MNKTLDQLLSLAANQAHLVLLGLRQPELIHSSVFIQEDGSSQILATPFANDGQKDATVAYVKAWMKNHGTVAYSFLAEGWQATLTPEEWNPDSGPIPEGDIPRNRVDRTEVVLPLATDGHETEYRWPFLPLPVTGPVIGSALLILGSVPMVPITKVIGLGVSITGIAEINRAEAVPVPAAGSGNFYYWNEH